MFAIGRLMIDSLATSALERKHSSHKPQQVNIVDTNMTDTDDDGDHVVNIEVLHVLEVGGVVHSVIIGVSLGTSESAETIKPLLSAILCFHQFFEGIGLGGCDLQSHEWNGGENSIRS
ncbi:hypothetical protein NL676_023860 [Syzygium grande]|nr:hypothetical protein NL676_023860 [Syzygium grande]